MSSQYVVILEGLDGVDFSNEDAKITTAARQAVNRALDRARTQAAREIMQQVNFKASYLRGQDSRLTVTQRASNNNLEGVISGRRRATSLAQFTKSGSPAAVRRAGGATVEVKPGTARFLRNSWLVNLRAGASKTDTNFNRGLAIRLKPGDSLRNSRSAVRLDKNVWLLYGPSVAQVFQTVRGDIAPDTLDFLEQEFDRLRALGDF